MSVRARLATSAAAKATEDRELLERLLAAAKQRPLGQAEPPPPPPPPEPNAPRTPFLIQTFDAIDPLTLNHLTNAAFEYQLFDSARGGTPQAILLRSHALMDEEVPLSVRAVAACGQDTSSIAVEALTRRGIPVFSTPDAEANAVKELALCGLLLASRGIIEGIELTTLLAQELVCADRCGVES